MHATAWIWAIPSTAALFASERMNVSIRALGHMRESEVVRAEAEARNAHRHGQENGGNHDPMKGLFSLQRRYPHDHAPMERRFERWRDGLATGWEVPAVILLSYFLVGGMEAGQTPTVSQTQTPVLVELFTSEGCSSCPPADRFLERLDKLQPLAGVQVLVMSEHVDYWNHDGWVDPFSSAEFTLRQQAYDLRLKSEPYTPQMVVYGSRQCIGSSETEAEAAIRDAARQPKLAVRIVASPHPGSSVSIEVDGSGAPAHRADVYAALADDNGESDVLLGENKRLRLHHVVIVRKLRKLGKLDKLSSFRGDLSVASFAGGRVIGFVQEPGTGTVLGAALYRIPR